MQVKQESEEFYRFNIGQFNCISVSDGSYEYALKGLFPGMSEDQLEGLIRDFNLPGEKISTPYTFLFVDTGNNKILVDMGAGKLGPDTGKLLQNLKSAGIRGEDIDTIFITHAHPDHIGGTLNEEGQPNYPDARYIIWKEEWDFWFSAQAFQEVTNHYAQILPVEIFMKAARGQLGPLKDRIEFLSEEKEVFPGVQVHPVVGHTPGHMVVSFVSQGEQLVFIGDAVVFPFLLERPEILPAYDIMPDVAVESRRKLCDRLAERNALVLAQHFPPFPSLGHIRKHGNGWRWDPVKL